MSQAREESAPSRRRARIGWSPDVWLMLVAAAPVVVAVIRAFLDGWLPMGDNAYFTARSLDVLGPAHPLVGAWSSGSASLDAPVNNLGPLQLDLLAPFTRVDPELGTAVGVAAVNVGCMVGAGLVVRRLLSSSLAAAALMAAALVAWTMGSALLLEPRQHHALMLPWFCFLVVCWGLSAGDRWLLPWAVGLGSLLVQTHLSYLLLVPPVAIWAVVGLLLSTRRAGRVAPIPWWHRLRTPAGVAVAVAVVLWIQSAIDQVAGTGNLGRLADTGSTAGGTDPGLGAAVRIAGSVLAAPWNWGRQGFHRFDPENDGSTLLAAAGLGAVLALLGVLAVLAHRRGGHTAAAAPATAAVAVVSSLVAIARTPAGALGPLPGNYRWLWPLAAFVLLATIVGVVAAVPWVRPARTGWWVSLGSVVVLVALSVANLPASYQIDLAYIDHHRRHLAADLMSQLDQAELPEPLLYDRTGVAFSEPYSYLVVVALQARGIDFTVNDDSTDAFRFGDARRDRGRARYRLELLTGPAARSIPEDGRRVAFVTSVTAADRRERAVLQERVVAAARAGVLGPDAEARRSMDDVAYPAMAKLADGEEPSAWTLRGDLNRLRREGHLVGPPEDLAALERLEELDQQEIYENVALLLRPQP